MPMHTAAEQQVGFFDLGIAAIEGLTSFFVAQQVGTASQAVAVPVTGTQPVTGGILSGNTGLIVLGAAILGLVFLLR